jgi:cytoskeletal protein RodZ
MSGLRTKGSDAGAAFSKSGQPANESSSIAAEEPQAAQVMASIGNTLRDERLRRGLTVEQVAAETKICPFHLKAMEADRFDLPVGPFFVRSFLRQYAHILDLDGAELIASLNQHYELAQPLPEPLPEHRELHLPRLPALVWVLAILVCAGIYNLWENRQLYSPNVETSVKPRHEAKRADLRPAFPPFASREQPKLINRQPEVSNAGMGPTVAGDRESAQEAPSAMRVTFTATEPVWLSIKSDGAYAYSGILGQQQSKEIEAAIQMMVLVGNAGGLGISINGRPVGPIGTRGEVQLLELTPTGGARIVPRTQTPQTASGEGEPPEKRIY